MDSSHQLEERDASKLALAIVAIAPLVGAAIVCWFGVHFGTPRHPIATALFFVAASVVVAFGMENLAARFLSIRTGSLASGTSLLAIWFPFVLLLRAVNTTAGLVMITIVAAAFAAAWRNWSNRLTRRAERPEFNPSPRLMFESWRHPYGPPSFDPIAVASTFVGLTAVISGKYSSAAALIAIGVFALSLKVFASRIAIRATTRSAVGKVLAHTAASFVLCAAILYLANMRPGYWLNAEEAVGSKAGNNALTHTGILLFSNVKKVRVLAPPVKATQQATSQRSTKVQIPFTGEYWFYPLPMRRLPASAVTEHGSPIDFKFRAVEQTTLVMQAHQKLGEAIDFKCCTKVGLLLINADAQAEAVMVQVLLRDSRTEPRQNVSLGLQRMPRLSPARGNRAQETLLFEIPKTAPDRAFDEIIVWFHLENPRRQRSAAIAIEGFELIP